MATAPRPGVSRRAEDDARVISCKIDDELFVLRLNDISGYHELLLKQQTGMTLAALFSGFTGNEVYVWAAIVWLARLQRGEDVSYRTIAESLNQATVIQDAAPEEVEAAPEA